MHGPAGLTSFLTDQHPVTEWLVDKVLVRAAADNTLQRRLTAPVIVAEVAEPVFLVNGCYSNKQGKPTVLAWMALHALPGGRCCVGRGPDPIGQTRGPCQLAAASSLPALLGQHSPDSGSRRM
jgi:hypothetical protein